MSVDFDWNRKRTIQTMSPNRVIQDVQVSPKEVIAVRGNRFQMENVIDSLCIAVNELMQINEEQAARIASLSQAMEATPNGASEPGDRRD